MINDKVYVFFQNQQVISIHSTLDGSIDALKAQFKRLDRRGDRSIIEVKKELISAHRITITGLTESNQKDYGLEMVIDQRKLYQ